MKKVIIGTLAAALMVVGGGGASGSTSHSEEGCQAANPGQPTCTYTVTHVSATPVTGFTGTGTWVAKIKSGKRVTTVNSPAPGEPPAVSYEFTVGDKVTLTALTPGTVAAAGHVD